MPDNSDFGMDPAKMSGGPWGSGGGSDGGDGGSPWKRPTGSGGNGGGSGGGGGGPDLEEQMKRMQERFRSRRRGGRGGGRKGGAGPGFGKGSIALLLAVGAFAWLTTGIVVVDAGEQATVFQFGKFKTNFDAGYPCASAAADRDA